VLALNRLWIGLEMLLNGVLPPGSPRSLPIPSFLTLIWGSGQFV